MGKIPHDWDLCTSAAPEEMKAVFAGERVVETGLKHGTLTVVRDHVPYEITTYRTEGVYTDHRHPDAVSFVADIREDLSRRDFTVNAMACGADGQVLDLFGGREDLSAGIIRCVGEPELRFGEDALRILRALRFASVLDFSLEPGTAKAVHRLYPTLERVSAERIREELCKLLCGPGVGRILREYTDVLSFLIPPIGSAVGYDQQNPHHLFTVWEHTVRAVENVPPLLPLRMTMLLHDLGKPLARITDAQGIGHYPGHQRISAEIARKTLTDLRCDNALTERVTRLVEAHDIPLDPSRKTMLHRLNRFGEEDLRSLFLIHRADRIATGTRNPEHAGDRCRELNAALDALLAEKPCFSLKDLAVNGRDLTALGLSGPDVGKALNQLLDAVLDETVPNEKEALLHHLQYS
jgi:tRNA nucleotidyltransferase (CCA-adding enzyme)